MKNIFKDKNLNFLVIKDMEEDELIVQLEEMYQDIFWSVNQRYDVEGNSFNLIHAASLYKKNKVLKWLLEHGADPDIFSGNGTDAAGFVCLAYNSNINKALEALDLLIHHGANFNQLNDSMFLPIEFYFKHNPTHNQKILNKLLEVSDLKKNNEHNPWFTFLDKLELLTPETIQKMIDYQYDFNYQIMYESKGKTYKEGNILTQLVYLNKEKIKQFDNIFKEIPLNYQIKLTDENFDFELSLIDYSIIYGSGDAFKWFIKKFPSLLKDKCQIDRAIELSINNNFKSGLLHFIKKQQVDWSKKSEYLDLASSQQMIDFIEKHHTKFMYEQLNKDLMNKESSRTKLKI